MMKRIVCILVCIILSACSIINKYPNTLPGNYTENTIPIDIYLKNNFPTNSSISQFEKKMPDSSLILNSTICFYPDYQGFYLYNVDDFWVQKNILLILKDKDIITNQPFCSKINTNATNNQIIYSNLIILLKSKQRLCFYDLAACGKLLSKKNLSSSVYFFNPYLIFVKSNRFAVETFTQNRPIFLGITKAPIKNVLRYRNYLIFLGNDGKLYIYNTKTSKLSSTPVIKDLISDFVYSNNILLIKTKNNFIKFIKLIKSKNNKNNFITFKFLKTLGPFKHIVLARHSLYAYADGKIYGIDTNITCKKILKDFDLVNGIVFSFIKKKKQLFIFKLKKIFYKIIIFSPPKIRAYKEKDFIILFDIDGKERIIDLSDNSSILAKKPIDVTYLTPLRYSMGNLYNAKGQVLCKLAKIVNKDNKWLMLKRPIGNRIYFYFEKITKK